MQKHFHYLMGILLLGACVISCTQQSSTNNFTSKEDSVKFARAVYNLYAEDVEQVEIDTSRGPGKKGVHPIPWDTVKAYQDYYDRDPKLFTSNNQPYKGFSIDANGYKWITKNKAIEAIYLRLGRKGDGSYTVMMLGTDSSGRILHTKTVETSDPTKADPTNFDNAVPCPTDCPVDDNNQ
ncbi:MAG: hypothetical protein V4725_18525 [Bacteroidota bacterium]